jgi:hypothetical protein
MYDTMILLFYNIQNMNCVANISVWNKLLFSFCYKIVYNYNLPPPPLTKALKPSLVRGTYEKWMGI